MDQDLQDDDRMETKELLDLMVKLTREYLSLKSNPQTPVSELQKCKQSLKQVHIALGIKGRQLDE